jgi:Fe-S-cluster containining protein
MVFRTPVPCAGCTACCHGELVVLFPEDGDDLARFEHREVASEYGPIHVLKHKDNGDCWYLGAHDCTVHDHAPAVCKSFDCRSYFLSMTRSERRTHEKHCADKASVFRAGRERPATLSQVARDLPIAGCRVVGLPTRQYVRKMMVER